MNQKHWFIWNNIFHIVHGHLSYQHFLCMGISDLVDCTKVAVNKHRTTSFIHFQLPYKQRKNLYPSPRNACGNLSGNTNAYSDNYASDSTSKNMHHDNRNIMCGRWGWRLAETAPCASLFDLPRELCLTCQSIFVRLATRTLFDLPKSTIPMSQENQQKQRELCLTCKHLNCCKSTIFTKQHICNRLLVYSSCVI